MFEGELKRTDTLSDAKRSLLQLLGSLYTATNQSTPLNESSIQLNSQILAIIKDTINSGNTTTEKSAVLVYSRLGYFGDSEEVIGNARASGILSPHEYAKEITYLIPLAKSSEDQNRLIGKLMGSGASPDIISAEISSAIQMPGYLSSLQHSAVNALSKNLKLFEPTFGTNENELGMIDAIQYTNWLSSRTELAHALGSNINPGDVYAKEILNSPNAPRKALSVMISQLSESAINSLAQQGKLETVKQIIDTYGARLKPDNPIQQMISEVNLKISSKLQNTK
jgi:hypothetical protein